MSEIDREAFASFFENSLDAAALYSVEGTLVVGNDAARALTGYRAGELFHQPYWRHIVEHDRERADRMFERALRGEPQVGEIRFLSATGENIPVRIQLFAATAHGKTVGVYGVARDLRGIKAMEREVYRRYDELRSLVTHNPDPVALLHPDGRLEYVNDALLRLIGVRLPNLASTRVSWLDFFDEETREGLTRSFEAALAGIPQSVEARTAGRVRNTPLDLRIKLIPLESSGEVRSLCAVITDITIERASEERMLRLAFYDPLTGLPNRALLNDRLSQLLANAKRYSRFFAVHYLDLDGFKSVNDEHGHAAGDDVLRETGHRLISAVRESDTVSRIGGDEFVVLQTIAHVPEDASAMAQKIIELIAEPFTIGDSPAQLSTSIGIALYPFHGTNGRELLDRADAALYEVKHGAKNGYAFATAP